MSIIGWRCRPIRQRIDMAKNLDLAIISVLPTPAAEAFTLLFRGARLAL